jgi:2-polyprenyl-6-hydroxyphenyl methylase/3-demethylubiquinone-9 3-methyltransferase
MNNKSTLNSEEVEKFSRIADEWWDEHGKFKPLHLINPVLLEFITSEIKNHFALDGKVGRYLDGLNILDIGCGGGLLSEPMARLGGNVTGIDASEKNVRVAGLHAEKSGLSINYLATTAEELVAEMPQQFDVILNMEVIEHVADPEFLINSCQKLLKPDGIMFVSTINRSVKSMVMAKIGAEYILRWLPKGTHDWKKFLKPSEIAGFLARNGLRYTAMKGLTFNPIHWEWSLSDDLSVNYFVVAKY